MLRILIVGLAGVIFSSAAQAAAGEICWLNLEVGTSPTTLTVAAQTIYISADAASDTTASIGDYYSPSTTAYIRYEFCNPGTPYGKRTENLSGVPSSDKIYPTNIPGIGVKLWFNNATAEGAFPSDAKLSFPDNQPGLFSVYPGSHYHIQFFKTSDRLRLKDPLGDTVLEPNEYGYNWLSTPLASSYFLKLYIDKIKIISTPVCTPDSAKNIDFDTVTPSLLKNGVERDLDFAITCKSDYGHYTARASITTNTPSSDASTIRVADASGNKDKLAIQITDSNGKAMKLDGTTSEQRSSTSQGPAEYSWKARLIAGPKPAPAEGVFTAKAEIIFDIE